ncbi:MAG: hypothetical protein D8M56_24280, partial [Chloroflexi bacterium]|nr:hypothetical protein [Chloroflexota bacterium]
MKITTNPLEKTAPSPRRRRRGLISPKLLLIWLAILALECAGVTAVAAFWVLTPGRGLALSPAAAL